MEGLLMKRNTEGENMNELLKVSYDSDRITVSARELHKFLGVSERFSNWFERMSQYGMVAGEDFVGCKVFNTQAHQELQDYQLTIECAKEICMLQRNERGKQARQYFIQLEKDWNSPEKVMARALQIADRKINHLEARVEEMKPKELFADAVSASKSSILIGDLAKIMRQNGVKIGRDRLFDYLRDNGYLVKSGSSKNMPTQRSMEMGLFEVKESTITHSDGHISISKTTKVTGKGQIYFVNKIMG